MCIGVLRFSVDRIGINHCNITFHGAGHTLVRFTLVGPGIPLGDAGVFYFRGTICEERTAITSLVSGIFLLFAYWVVDPIILSVALTVRLDMQDCIPANFAHF